MLPIEDIHVYIYSMLLVQTQATGAYTELNTPLNFKFMLLKSCPVVTLFLVVLTFK